MKKFLTVLLLTVVCGVSFSQAYRNEWINYSNTYYKFKVSATGIYRIPKSQLQTIGLGNTAAQNFQLWHNGVEVPLYTTATSGLLASDGYLEFYGQTNDGTPDTDVYPDPSYQPSTVRSLFEDQGTYFLTINSESANARFANTANSLTNPGTAEPYCLYNARRNYTDQLWGGYASVISGEYVRSATFDKGEGFQSGAFVNTNVTFNNLKVYTAGPAMSIKVRGSGAAIGGRKIFYNLNGTLLDSTYNYSFETYDLSNSGLPVTGITNDAVSLDFISSSSSNDYAAIMLSDISISYPRQFSFGGMSQVSFSVPANASGSYLEITNFNSSSVSPILYDITARKRYVCQLNGNTVQVKLDPATTTHAFVLLSSAVINTVASFTSRTFVDYSSVDNQGDYLIITNSLLNSGSNNQVQAYANYRSSVAGGSYAVKVMDVSQLTDQFAYGIKLSPLCIRNFLRFARDNYSVTPKFALLIGHGTDYISYRNNEGNANKDLLNLVPTWGNPGSDNLLGAANNNSPNIATPIGRISVTNNTELQNYLAKVVEYEQARVSSTHQQETEDWRKQVLHLIGASDAATADIIIPMMDSYRQIISGPSVGAQVGSYVKANNPNLTQSTAEVANRINSGVSLITYFGHSSTSSLDFSLNNPSDYTNTNGKYPVFIANGCLAGNFFAFDDSRLAGYNYTISEKFLLAQSRGSIAFIASTHYGVVNTLDYLTRYWYDAATGNSYGKSLGEIQQAAIQGVWSYYTGDYHTRLTLEETAINGDPAIKIFAQTLPDYSLEPQNITVTPGFISSADDSVYVQITPFNLGKALSTPVALKVERKLPDGTTRLIRNITLATLRHTDTLNVSIPIIGNLEKGTNQVIVTIDPANVYAELSETNNTTTKDFEISDDEIRPVYPYTLSVVNTPSFRLSASTVNPFQAARPYRVQMDTTEKFNSSLLYSRDTISSGGVVGFPPMSNLQNDKVYYWRVAPVINGTATNWRSASFLYNSNGTPGWNQSHFYQKMKSAYQQMSLDSVSRSYSYRNRINNLFITHSKFPESGTEQSHFSIAVNGDLLIRSACLGKSVIFCVFDTISFKPWQNLTGLYGSYVNCNNSTRSYNFEFSYLDATNRKKMMDFMDIIPNGYYVVARLILDPDPGTSNSYNYSLANTWKADTALFGSGKSLYHSLQAQGAQLDSINVPSGRIWSLTYRKNSADRFAPHFDFSPTIYDRITTSIDCPTIDTIGYVTSPKFGPARSWQNVHWRGHSVETSNSPDSVLLTVYGFDNAGNRYPLISKPNSEIDFSIANIDATVFPYLQLQLRNQDAVNASPWQLDSWKIDYTPAPEGGIAPNLYFAAADTANIDSMQLSRYPFGVAFKNVSSASFDSVKVKITLTDSLGNSRQIVLPKVRPIASGDTAKVYFELSTDTMVGRYNMLVDINPDNDQIEQQHFNNFLYKSVVVLRSSDLGICPGSSITYKAENAAVGTYRWQVDTGTGYIDVVDNAIYSGTSTTSLRLTAPPTAWYGYKYRCMITSGGTTYSREFVLKFAVKWNGTFSTAWENVSNWTCGVLPDEYTDVIINSAISRYPVVNSSASCRSIKALPNSTIRVTTGNSLKVAGKPGN